MTNKKVDFLGLHEKRDSEKKYIKEINGIRNHVLTYDFGVSSRLKSKKNSVLFGHIKRNPLCVSHNAYIKRFSDIIISSLVIVFILSWLVPLLAVLIKRDSSGPVFYKQKRSGRNNKTFQCFKFRTMSYEENAQFIAATKNDLRVTKIGRFLRKTSLDEFPQFFNVLLGDMSIVGPRPHPIKLNEDYQNKVEKYMLRHIIKPGITGLAQAKGYRGEVSSTLTMRQRIKIDIFYVENWSMWLDIKIIMLTALNIVQGDKNAY